MTDHIEHYNYSHEHHGAVVQLAVCRLDISAVLKLKKYSFLGFGTPNEYIRPV